MEDQWIALIETRRSKTNNLTKNNNQHATEAVRACVKRKNMAVIGYWLFFFCARRLGQLNYEVSNLKRRVSGSFFVLWPILCRFLMLWQYGNIQFGTIKASV